MTRTKKTATAPAAQEVTFTAVGAQSQSGRKINPIRTALVRQVTATGEVVVEFPYTMRGGEGCIKGDLALVQERSNGSLRYLVGPETIVG